MIEELYAASQAGARMDILCRGVCSLRPGVPGFSERIRVRSVLGRFLEHSRLFVLEAGDRSDVLLGSADLMPRNLDHRVEVLTPGRGAQAPGRARGEPRRAARGHDVLLGAASRRHVGARPGGEGGAASFGPVRPDAPRAATGVARTFALSALRRLHQIVSGPVTGAVGAPSGPGPDDRVGMSVGVLDVGSNTIRLLVARVERGDVVPVGKEKVRLPLGEEIERYGFVSDVHVAQAAKAVRRLTGDRARPRRRHARRLPHRARPPERNADELVAALTRAARVTRAGALGRGGGPARLRGRRRDLAGFACRGGSRSATSAAPRPRSRSAPRTGSRLGPVGRARLRPADRPRRRRRARHTRRARRGARRGAGRVRRGGAAARWTQRSPSAAAPGPLAASSAPALGEASSRRRCGSSGEVPADDRPPLRRRPGAGAHPAGRARPARGGAAPARRAVAGLRRRHPRGRRPRVGDCARCLSSNHDDARHSRSFCRALVSSPRSRA